MSTKMLSFILGLNDRRCQGTVVKYLALPINENITLNDISYQRTIDRLKRLHDIDLVVDLAPTLSGTDYAGLLGSLIKINSSDYDMYMIDVVWPGQYADSFLDISPYVKEEVKKEHVENIYNANNIAGKQVAVPYFADYGMLYYRTDLLLKYNFTGPPQTWEEMETMMSIIVPAERRTNPAFQGYIGQYNAYEGLTCNFMEWVFSVGGGTIIEPNKTVSVNNPAVIGRPHTYKSWLKPPKSYTPLTGLVYDETASLNTWIRGNALFLRSWPYVNSVTAAAANFPKLNNASAFAMGRLPGAKAGQSASVLGGWQLAVNKWSKNPAAAAIAVQALITKEAQMERFKDLGVMPTVASLYSDPEFCRLNPQCSLFGSLQVAARPSSGTSPYYLAASEQIYLQINKILRDEISVVDGLKDLSVNLQKAIKTYVEPAVDLGPPVFVSHTSPVGLAFQVTAGLLALLSISLFIIILLFRRHKLLQSSSPLFMLIMVVGTLIAHGAVFAYTGEPSDAACVVQPWLVVLAYGVTVAALVTKNWRIYKIFRNKYMTKVNLQDTELLKACLLLVAINLVLLIVWTVVDPPKKVLIKLATSQFHGCQSRSSTFNWGILGGLLSYNSLLLGVGVFLAYSTRNVEGPFNESKYIGYTIYTMVLLNIILIPLSFIESFGPLFQYAFRAIAIELSALAVTLNMFIPKIITLFQHKDDNVAPDVLKKTKGVESSTGKSKNIRNMMSDMMEGVVYVRYGKTKFAMSLASWKDMNMVLIPSSRLVVLYPTEKETKTDVGISFVIRSITIEDTSIEGQFVFNAVLNGTFYEMQVANAELKERWMKMLTEMTGTSVTGSVTGSQNAATATV
ncbi:hypothetical protein BC829DRAFT_414074 [Chytridium lagenaria]|nr:hypothetical protein BC829DRAFT_414074 [Chytridium lagenaria]